MRVSLDTLILLAREGDRFAEITAIWLYQNRCAEAWAINGNIGAGWPGVSNARRWPIGIQGKQYGQ